MDERRTLPQNARLWAMLHDVATQVQWSVNGYLTYMDPADWKDVFTSGLTKHQRVAQGIEGGWVLLGERTSRMSKAQMSELITLMEAFGAEHGVRWTDEDNEPL